MIQEILKDIEKRKCEIWPDEKSQEDDDTGLLWKTHKIYLLSEHPLKWEFPLTTQYLKWAVKHGYAFECIDCIEKTESLEDITTFTDLIEQLANKENPVDEWICKECYYDRINEHMQDKYGDFYEDDFDEWYDEWEEEEDDFE